MGCGLTQAEGWGLTPTGAERLTRRQFWGRAYAEGVSVGAAAAGATGVEQQAALADRGAHGRQQREAEADGSDGRARQRLEGRKRRERPGRESWGCERQSFERRSCE